MKKIYVAKNDKGKYFTWNGSWVKDINKAVVYGKKSQASVEGTPVLVNIVEAKED